MSFFKKIGKGISSIAKKAPSVVSNIFKKGGDISQGVSQGLGKVSDVLGKIGSVANNPLVQAGASSILGPEAGMALGSFSKSLSGVKDTLNKGRDIVGRAGGIEKAKELYSDAHGVAGPQFM
jgi:hypothetical protein